MRESIWSIIWEPEGETPLVLLAVGDLVDHELRLPRDPLVAIGKSDFSLRSTAIPRGNVKRRLEFNRRIEHATAVGCWQDCVSKLKAAPWGKKGVLRIVGEGEPEDYSAALLSTRHRPSFEDGVMEAVHDYAFRVNPI